MSPDECRRAGIVHLLQAKPFECDVVGLLRVESGVSIPLGETASELWRLYREQIAAVARGDCWGMGAWEGVDSDKADASKPGVRRLSYAACAVGDLVVVMGKRCRADQADLPIDGYFLDDVRRRICGVLGLAPPAEATPDSDSSGRQDGDTSSELKALSDLGALWRREYGEGVWLAVRDGSVWATGKTLADAEDAIAKVGIPPPVLYVPPTDRSHGD